jgi:hypothetical protein
MPLNGHLTPRFPPLQTGCGRLSDRSEVNFPGTILRFAHNTLPWSSTEKKLMMDKNDDNGNVMKRSKYPVSSARLRLFPNFSNINIFDFFRRFNHTRLSQNVNVPDSWINVRVRHSLSRSSIISSLAGTLHVHCNLSPNCVRIC